MKIEVPVYITPEKGQWIICLAEEIANAKKEGKIGNLIFLNLPDGKVIKIEGDTTSEIRDSICTQYAGDFN